LVICFFIVVVRSWTRYRASHDGEFAYPTRSSESSLSRRRVWIYSPLVKIPPKLHFTASSPTARKYSLLSGGAYAPADAQYAHIPPKPNIKPSLEVRHSALNVIHGQYHGACSYHNDANHAV
jgi:hypothetical protein